MRDYKYSTRNSQNSFFFNKVTDYKTNTENSVASLYSNDTSTENKIREKILFIIHTYKHTHTYFLKKKI